MVLNWTEIEQVGIGAIVGAMNRGTARMTSRAKELAPVRKVFDQHKGYSVRTKSIDEIENDRDVRRRLGLGPESLHINPPQIVTKRAPQSLSQRTIVQVDHYTGRRVDPHLKLRSAQQRLDRRGRYDLRTLRAANGDQLGGRLRDEIFATEATVEGKLIRARIESPTPYSKYQEFGTAHNPAHPYLRPAAHEGRQPLMADIAKSVAAAIQPRLSGRIDVTIKTRAR